MSADPILIIQLQRLGDLILTFPLLIDLSHKYRGHPLWIVAEPQFFEQLLPLAPSATFFPPSHLPQLAKVSYRAVINLGTRPEACICAEQAQSSMKLGPVQTAHGLRIKGFWQLYRASLTNNNHHNLFHWADLNRLDFGLPLKNYHINRPEPATGMLTGLFIGASEPAKRPAPEFWASLIRKIPEGFKPVLLGGPGEKEPGAAVCKMVKRPLVNLCGQTSLSQLANVIKKLNLLITPDTGPMHLANWLGTRVLDLSMGNVQPWETGPANPGQFVIEAAMSCAGCWTCHRPRLYCKDKFTPAAIARAVKNILQPETAENLPGLRIWQTARQKNGLYNLLPADNKRPAPILDYFWQNVFLFFFNQDNTPQLITVKNSLWAANPQIASHIARSIDKTLSIFLHPGHSVFSDSFWQNLPLHSRLLGGFLHMSLQNDDFSGEAVKTAVNLLAQLREILKQ